MHVMRFLKRASWHSAESIARSASDVRCGLRVSSYGFKLVTRNSFSTIDLPALCAMLPFTQQVFSSMFRLFSGPPERLCL